jgi:transcriptional regulator with XRE-family HTH domain
MVESTIGSALVERRHALGLAKGQAADNIGMSRTTYSSYEQDAQRPSVEVFLSLASFLDVSLEEFLLLYGATCVVAVREPLERLIAERASASTSWFEPSGGLIESEDGSDSRPDPESACENGDRYPGQTDSEVQPESNHGGVSGLEEDSALDIESAGMESKTIGVAVRDDLDEGAPPYDVFARQSAIPVEGANSFEPLIEPISSDIDDRTIFLSGIERDHDGSGGTKSKKKKKKKHRKR